MTWFTIFTFLLVVQFTVDTSDGVVIIVREDNYNTRFEMQDAVTPDSCELETNTGQKYQYTPISDINYDIVNVDSYCGVTLRTVQLDDAGEWRITAFFGTSERPPVTQKFKLYVEQIVTTVPNIIRMKKGYFAHAGIDLNEKNVTNCTFSFSPSSLGVGNEYFMEFDLLNEHTETVQRFGPCGFRMLINSTGVKELTLKAVVEDRIIYTSFINLDIRENTEESKEMEIITLNRGKSGTVILSADRDTTLCQLEGPMGLKSRVYESCLYNIPVVTSRHDGVWIARYGVRGNPIPIIERFRVVVRDTSNIDSNVTVTENNEIQLLCHAYDKYEIVARYCYFIRPDGYMLNLAPGIGTESYSAFNVSELVNFGSRNNVYCGLIIHQPKQYDYGSWKCGIGPRNKDVGSIVYVDPGIINTNETREIKVVAENVYVKRNDSFQIKCTAEAVLSYCWFRSPNGTYYTVTQMQDQSPTALPYVGLGLTLGECIVEVDHATYTDHGEWTCNVGIRDGAEKSRKFFINVTESYVIPESSALMANDGDNITLTCNILPNITDKEIRYCRWIHPDGHGIHSNSSHRYMVSQTNTQCRLMIPGKYSLENVGRWICVAGLYGLTDEESWSTITVYSQSVTTYVLTIMSIIATVLLIIILCISSYTYIRRKRLTPPCIFNDKSYLAQFFVNVHSSDGNGNKSLSREILK